MYVFIKEKDTEKSMIDYYIDKINWIFHLCMIMHRGRSYKVKLKEKALQNPPLIKKKGRTVFFG